MAATGMALAPYTHPRIAEAWAWRFTSRQAQYPESLTCELDRFEEGRTVVKVTSGPVQMHAQFQLLTLSTARDLSREFEPRSEQRAARAAAAWAARIVRMGAYFGKK